MIDLETSKKGDKALLKIQVNDSLIQSFAEYSGDRNPIHLDADYAKGTRFKSRVAHGMSYGALFSRLIGMDLPGPGALWMSQTSHARTDSRLEHRRIFGQSFRRGGGDVPCQSPSCSVVLVSI